MFCRDYISLIENYYKAKNDQSEILVCHHRGKCWKIINGQRVYYEAD